MGCIIISLASNGGKEWKEKEMLSLKFSRLLMEKVKALNGS